MHQGIIDVESILNEGSVFTVKIPTGKKHIEDHQISEKEIDGKLYKLYRCVDVPEENLIIKDDMF